MKLSQDIYVFTNCCVPSRKLQSHFINVLIKYRPTYIKLLDKVINFVNDQILHIVRRSINNFVLPKALNVRMLLNA